MISKLNLQNAWEIKQWSGIRRRNDFQWTGNIEFALERSTCFSGRLENKNLGHVVLRFGLKYKGSFGPSLSTATAWQFTNFSYVSFQVVEILLPNSLVNTDAQELQHILKKPHLKARQNSFTLILNMGILYYLLFRNWNMLCSSVTLAGLIAGTWFDSSGWIHVKHAWRRRVR